MLLLDQAPHSQGRRPALRAPGPRGRPVRGAGAKGANAVMALNDALTVRPNDQPITLLLSDAYVHGRGAARTRPRLLKPLITAHKGKASPGPGGAVRAAGPHRGAARVTSSRSWHALSRAVDADRKNGVLAAQLADRAEAAGDDELLVKALRTITMHPGNGPDQRGGGPAPAGQAGAAPGRQQPRHPLRQAGGAWWPPRTIPPSAEAKAFISSVGWLA